MTQTQRLQQLFDDNGGRLTLGTIMGAYLGASYRQRLSELRRELNFQNKTIVCHQVREEGKKSETYWEIVEMRKPVPDENGQMVMAI